MPVQPLSNTTLPRLRFCINSGQATIMFEDAGSLVIMGLPVSGVPWLPALGAAQMRHDIGLGIAQYRQPLVRCTSRPLEGQYTVGRE
jgi:hypothetical protein